MKNTEIIVITDRSGSMQSIRNDVIGGYNKFIEDQKTEPGDVRVTYVQFDGGEYAKNLTYSMVSGNLVPGSVVSVQRNQPTAYELVYQARPLAEVPPLTAETFVPRGTTALYDAIGRTLEEQGRRIRIDAWAEVVIVYIITDGGENASVYYTQDRIKEMVSHAEKHGWNFLFLAANQDAFASAQSVGSSGIYAATFNATEAGTLSAYASASDTSKLMRSGVAVETLSTKQTF